MDLTAEMLADVVTNGPCGLLATSPRGNILAINETLLGWLGYAREDLIGRKRFQELMTVSGKIFYDTHFAPLLRMQGFVYEIAVDLARVDGAAVPVFVSANERRSAAGEVEAIRIAVFPATDRRKYERELVLARRMAEQGLKAKSDFLAVFAHEVRNALGAVPLGLDALREAGVPAAGDRALAMIQRSLDRVLALLRSMLDFSKFEAGKVTLEQRRFDLRELVHGVVQTLEPIAERKGLPLVVEIAPDVPDDLLGDAVKIGQVVANLVGNAVKFTDAGAVTVMIEVVERAERSVVVRFAVRDTGIGIAPERIGRIFDEYTQASPDIGARYGGTGLGLAISRRIVELHGSKIEVSSRPGVETTFSFTLSLPLAAPAAVAAGDR